MKFKAGDIVKFKNIDDLASHFKYGSAGNFHKTHQGKKMKVYEIDGSLNDPRIVLEGNNKFWFKPERFRKCGIGIKLDDGLFQL